MGRGRPDMDSVFVEMGGGVGGVLSWAPLEGGKCGVVYGLWWVVGGV
jgi:hypothetical protein